MKNENESAKAPVIVNAFHSLLAMLEDGETQHEASRKLTELVEGVTLRNKPGKLTITLTATPANRGGCTLNFEAEVTLKLPKLPSAETLLFVDPEKGFVLSKENPKQKAFQFAEVKRPEGEAAEAKVEAAPAKVAAAGR